MADDLTETMDDLKDEIKRLTEKIPVVQEYRKYQAGLPPAPPKYMPGEPGFAEEIAWGMGGAGVVRGAGAIGSAAWQSAKAKAAGGVVQTYFPSGATLRMSGSIGSAAEIAAAEAALAPELTALHQVSKPVISRVGTAATTEAAELGLFARGAQALGGARESLFGTPKSSLYYGTSQAAPGIAGRAGGLLGAGLKTGILSILAYGGYTAYESQIKERLAKGKAALGLGPEVEEGIDFAGPPTGAEAMWPPSTLLGTAMWGGVEEAPQMVTMAAMQAFASGDPARMQQALMETKASAERSRTLFEALSAPGITPTMDPAMKEVLDALDAANRIREAQLAAEGYAEPVGVAKGIERKGLKEDLAYAREDLGIEKAQLALLTTEYDVNKESIKEWTTVRFAGETVAQESIQNVKYEILEQQKLALAYSSTLDEIEAYRTSRTGLSNEMTLGIATTNLEMVNEAKGSAQKERLTVDLEKLRAEKQLHTAQTAVTVGEMQLEMSSYNDVQLKIGELENTLSGLETNYSLKYERMRNDVKFFVQAHEDAATDIPNSVGEVTDKLQPLLDRQGEITKEVEAFKESIKFKGNEIIDYRTQIQGLTKDLGELAKAQRMESELSGGSYTYTSMPSDTQPRQIDPISSGGGGSDWASAGGHFDEFGRRISVVPIYST